MNKLKKINFIVIIGGLFTGICILLTYINIFSSYDQGRHLLNVWVLLVGTIVLLCGIRFVVKGLDRCSDKVLRMIAYTCLGIMILVTIGFAIGIRAVVADDLWRVHIQGREIQENNIAAAVSYFKAYTNNNFLAIVLSYIFRIGHFFGISDYKGIAVAGNICCIVGSILMGYFIVLRCFTRKIATLYMVLCLINPVIYTYVPIYYTDTMSLPFVLGMLYCYIRSIQEKLKWKRAVFLFLTGVLCILGYRMRGSVLIMGIAVILYEIIRLHREKRLLRLIVIFVGIFFAIFLYGKVEKHYFQFDTSDSSYPVTHWIMMGLQGEGGYSREDDEYTRSFSTKVEKREATVNVIKERLNEMGIGGYAKLLYMKLKRVWGVGTHRYEQYLGQVEYYTSLYEWVVGDSNRLFVYYCQCFYILTWIGMIGTGFYVLKTKHYEYYLLFILCMLGSIAFYLLWEAHPKCSFNMCIIMIILMLKGISLLTSCQVDYKFLKIESCESKSKEGDVLVCIDMKRIHRVLENILIVATVVAFIIYSNTFTNTEQVRTQYSVLQNFDKEQEKLYINSESGITQSFVTAKPFNQIKIQAKDMLEDNQEYQFQISSVNHKTIYCTNFNQKDIRSDSLEFKFDTIIPEDTTTYYIQIKPATHSNTAQNSSICLLGTIIQYYDVYPAGEMWNGDEKVDGDLLFEVSKVEQKAILSKSYYWGMCGILVVAEIFVIVRKRKLVNKLCIEEK